MSNATIRKLERQLAAERLRAGLHPTPQRALVWDFHELPAGPSRPFTASHIRAIAEVIAQWDWDNTELAHRFAMLLKASNPRFKFDRFYKACGLVEIEANQYRDWRTAPKQEVEA